MLRCVLYITALALLTGVAQAQDQDQDPAQRSAQQPAQKSKKAAQADKKDKLLSGMSIVGNDEAPKSLVIVPWKSSQLGHSLDLSKILDDGRQPVDKDVFLRELTYYQIREAATR